jgi:hypothetical protein
VLSLHRPAFWSYFKHISSTLPGEPLTHHLFCRVKQGVLAGTSKHLQQQQQPCLRALTLSALTLRAITQLNPNIATCIMLRIARPHNTQDIRPASPRSNAVFGLYDYVQVDLATVLSYLCRFTPLELVSVTWVRNSSDICRTHLRHYASCRANARDCCCRLR